MQQGGISLSSKSRTTPPAPHQETSSRKHGSHLVHSRNGDGHSGDQQSTDQKRSTSLLNHDLGLDDRDSVARPSSYESKPDASLSTKKDPRSHFGGSSNPNGLESSGDGRRPSKEASRLQMELNMAAGDHPDRRNGTKTDGNSTAGLQTNGQHVSGHQQAVDAAAALKKARSDSLKGMIPGNQTFKIWSNCNISFWIWRTNKENINWNANFFRIEDYLNFTWRCENWK